MEAESTPHPRLRTAEPAEALSPPLPHGSAATARAVVPELVVPPVAHLHITPMGDVMAEVSAGNSVFQDYEAAYTERNLVARLFC